MRTMSIVPFSQLDSDITKMPSIFTSLFGDFYDQEGISSRTRHTRPDANVTKEEEGYRIDLAVPGYDRDDISVSIKDGTLTIEAEVTNESSNNYHKEFTVGSFCRQWTLPKNLDAEGIEANYKNGVLTLTIPTAEEDHRTINISCN